MAYTPINAGDVYGNNTQTLFGQFGMDPKGNNESGRWARQNQQVVGTGLTNANAFAANTLEPARQNSLQNLIARAQAGNVAAQTARESAKMVNQGREQGSSAATSAAARGFSPEFQESLRNAIMGNAQRNANQYIGSEDERLAQLQAYVQQMIQQGQQNPFLNEFLSLAQLIEQRYQQNQTDKQAGGLGGLGSILGMAANFIPGGQFANLLKPQYSPQGATSAATNLLAGLRI